LERDGKFPKRRRLSANAVGWLESEINNWLESRTVICGEANHEG
jgi:predicted DNA-binding transcriptional regulator AlpA